MQDDFARHARQAADPAVTAFEITPDDAADLARVTTGLNVASPGKVRVTMADGSDATVEVHPGGVFPIRVRRVWLTGTTATGIMGLA